MERTVGQQPGERVGTAPFELDEAADAVVDPKARRLPVARRPPVELVGEPPRRGQGRLAVHLQVELDDGEGAREVGHRERGARNGECGETRPEDRFAEHGSTLLPALRQTARRDPDAAGARAKRLGPGTPGWDPETRRSPGAARESPPLEFPRCSRQSTRSELPGVAPTRTMPGPDPSGACHDRPSIPSAAVARVADRRPDRGARVVDATAEDDR